MDVFGLHLNNVTRGHRIQGHVGVGKFRPFREPRGAGSIKDDGRVLESGNDGIEYRRLFADELTKCHRPLDRRCRRRIGRDDPEVLAALDFLEAGPALLGHGQLRGALETEVRFGLAVFQMVGDFATLQQNIQGHHGRPGF